MKSNEEQLKFEIARILNSGASELHLFEMVKNFIDSRNVVNKNFVLADISPRIDWAELRNNFFNECTTETPREESGKKVNMAPHDLFEWFKREISEYVG